MRHNAHLPSNLVFFMPQLMPDANALSDLTARLKPARLKAQPLDCSADALVASLGWVAHGFEIVHTGFAGWKFTAAQAVTDAGLKLRLSEGGLMKDEGKGANVLDGPLQALLHFVRELRATPDAPALKAGDLVTTGPLTATHAVRPGQTWHTDIGASGPVAGKLAGLAVRFT